MRCNLFKTKFDHTPTKGVDFGIPSMVQQSDKDSTDINLIIKRFCECGICPDCTSKQPISEEVAALSREDFNTMMQKMASVNNQFNELPAEVRKKFDNNPANMLEFMQDPANREECEKLGLFAKSNQYGDINTPIIDVPVTYPSKPVVNQTGNQTVPTNTEPTQVNTGNLSE